LLEFKDKAAKNLEDDLSLSNKWMSYLEETVLNMTNGSIFLSKFGTGAKVRKMPLNIQIISI